MNSPGTRDTMAPDRWQRVQDVLADAIDCPETGRAALLDARCAGDAALRQEVESLLVAHDGAGLVDQLAPLVKPPRAWMTPTASEPTEWTGRRVAHYVVHEVLGAGGMGVVYKAVDDRLGRQAALKFLPSHLSADQGAKARFVAEARAAAALDHPNVCTIYEIGETEDGQLFIAMPLYEGETLHARLNRGRLTFQEALPIVLQVARGLGRAHDSGIVHRDVKPANIVVLPDGTAKVLDFGIAQIRDRAFADAPMLIGTTAYMSPEQTNAGVIDARSDIWSLAVVVHEMLAGVRPFGGDDAPEIAQAILTGDPRLTATSYPDVPSGIDRVLRRALAKSPDQRYASMSVLAAELAALAAVTDDVSGSQGFGVAEDPGRVSTTERRRAAVLVTVVSDYPSLVDRMTPNEAHQLIAQLRATAVDVAREFGGLVNQAIGEEIVSLFGVPVAHDDDDLRAVRAAVELHARVAAWSGVSAPADAGLSIQSGLHIGPVVARRLHEGPRRYDVAGAPATLAARLAAMAPRHGILVSPEAQRLVGPYMRTERCAPIVLDPHVGPVAPWQVLGESGIATRLEASTRAGLTPYVGRQSELSLLLSHATGTASGSGGVFAVVGEAGAGKSRLLYELHEQLRAAADVRVLRARCHAYGDSVPYGVFVQILGAMLDLRAPLGNADAVIARIRALDASLEPFLPLLLHLLSVRSERHALPKHLHGEHLQSALLDALATMIGTLARRGPVSILIEDWHWADTGSRAALLRIAELVGALPLVLILTSRMEPGNHEWPARTTRLHLARLAFGESVAIMQSVLGVRKVSEGLARHLDDRAGGNPFFIEQLCAALLERGALTISAEEAGADSTDETLSLPDTVQGVIRARLDNLEISALETLRVASVIGWDFDHALLAEAVPAHIDLGPALAALEAAGLIRQIAVAPTIAYRFTHALTQEVCYDTLVGHQRKNLHGAIGRALASAHARRVDDKAALLAYHFGRAEEWPAAIRFGRRAAERAIELSQFADALVTLDHVLEWVNRLSGHDDLVSDLLLQQERVCETLGLRARQQQIIDVLITRLAGAGASPRLAEVYLRQGDLSTLLKRFDEADRALGTAIRIGHEHGDATLLRSGLRSLGLLRWHEGRHAEAMDITQRVLAIDREYDDDDAVGVDLTNLGSILRAMGDYAGARTQLEAALALPSIRRDPKKLLYTRHNLANVHRALGDLDRALECLEQNDEAARTHLLPIQRSFHLTSIAHIQLQQGHIDVALETYRSAVDLSRRARHADGLVQSLRMLGNALLGLDRYDEALPYLQEAAQLFAQLEDRVSEAEMWTGIAQILERRAPANAADAWNTVLALQRQRGDARGELTAREGLARALRSLRADEAVAAYESALALAATIGASVREAALRNVLGNLHWEHGRYTEALRFYESALALVRDHGTRADEVAILNSLGVCLTKLGRRDEARTVLEQSLARSRETGARQLEAYALAALGQVALGAHDLNAAADYFEQSRGLRQGIGDRVGEGWMWLRTAAIQQLRGHRAGARAAIDAAVAAAADTQDVALADACAAASHDTNHA